MAARVASVVDGSRVQAGRQAGAVNRGPVQSEKIDQTKLFQNFRDRFLYETDPPIHRVGNAYIEGKVVLELNEKDKSITVKLPLLLSNDIQKRAIKDFFRKDSRNEQVEKTAHFEVKFGYSDTN